MIAHVLGAQVRKNTQREMGWYPITLTPEGAQDPVLKHFRPSEYLFQSHGDTFEIPAHAVHLASSALCRGQAFRYGTNVYGFQFHIEIDQPTIKVWLEMPENQQFFIKSSGGSQSLFQPDKIRSDTGLYLPRSIELSTETFRSFLETGGAKKRPLRITSGHGGLE
jgi:GMP synthase (glutamine-hydrolysing)